MRAALRRASAIVLLIPCAVGGAQAPTAAPPATTATTLPAGVAVGDPVRVWSPELGRRSGRHAVLAGWATDSLSLLPPGRWRRMRTQLEPAAGASPYAISRPSITRLEVRVARTRAEAAWKGGLLGGAAGVLNGLLLGAVLTRAFATESDPAFDIAVGGGTGLAMGALMGAAVPGGYWRRVQ